MEKIQQLVKKYLGCERPEYFSGRGATITDLNSDMLQGLYRDIKTHYGEVAAESYVKMVVGIKELSATNFIESLYGLYNRSWIYKSPTVAKKVIKTKYSETQYRALEVAVLMSSLSNGDDTQMIKANFCRVHGIKPKTKYNLEAGTVEEYY